MYHVVKITDIDFAVYFAMRNIYDIRITLH